MKKFLFTLALIAAAAGVMYIAVGFLREDKTDPAGGSGGSSSAKAASSSSQRRAGNTNIAAALVRNIPNDTVDDNLKLLRSYADLKSEFQTSVKAALGKALVELTKQERSVFETKVLETYLAMPAEERALLKGKFIDLLGSMPDNVISEPPLAAAPLARGTVVKIAAPEATGDVLVSVDPATGINLRLENFRVSKGPDLRLYLAKTTAPANLAEIGTSFIDLGALKGNAGSQNYVIPASTPVQEFTTLAIYSPVLDSVYAAASTK